MAASKSYFPRQSYRFLSTETAFAASHHDSAFELDESDMYNSGPAAEFRKTSGRLVAKKGAAGVGSGRRGGGGGGGDGAVVGGTPKSLPVNIPDWSKILKDEYRDIRRRDCVDDEDDDDDDDADGDDCLDGGGVRVPPHEFLARQMARTGIASFSVHEGVGRTLKGRDLSRVRNAIWEKTGFED